MVATDAPSYPPDLFVHVVHETDIVVRILLMKQEVREKLKRGFDEFSGNRHVRRMAQMIYNKMPGYAQLTVDLGQGIYNLYQTGGELLGEDEFFDYKPFGRYVFLEDGIVQVLERPERNYDWLTKVLPTLTPKSVMTGLKHHLLSGYVEFLEMLRTVAITKDEL